VRGGAAPLLAADTSPVVAESRGLPLLVSSQARSTPAGSPSAATAQGLLPLNSSGCAVGRLGARPPAWTGPPPEGCPTVMRGLVARPGVAGVNAPSGVRYRKRQTNRDRSEHRSPVGPPQASGHLTGVVRCAPLNPRPKQRRRLTTDASRNRLGRQEKVISNVRPNTDHGRTSPSVSACR